MLKIKLARLQVALTLVCSVFALIPMSASSTNYTVDSAQSAATYETRFLGLMPIRGTFTRLEGALVFDPHRSAGEIDVLIDATSLTASSEHARSVARGPDFFNTEKFPSIKFRSTRLVFTETVLVSVEGNLTLAGVTQPVTLQVASMACEPRETSPATCDARATVTVKRSAFGMRTWARTLADEVSITLQLIAHAVASPNKTGDPVMESPVVK